MRCALLALVALLQAQALRTEPLLEPALQPRQAAALGPVGGPGKFDSQALELQQQQQQQQQQQHWGEQTLRTIFSADELEDELDAAELGAEYPEEEQFRSIEQLDEAQLARLSSYLLKVLQRPGIYEPPVLLVKDPPPPPPNELDYSLQRDDLKSSRDKRTRYYRRYPWKRQNSRAYQSPDYDPYNPCTLTRKDVFKLLVALHDARQGNKTRTVNFCNRKRPASAVYTNIRFLGRRRK